MNLFHKRKSPTQRVVESAGRIVRHRSVRAVAGALGAAAAATAASAAASLARKDSA